MATQATSTQFTLDLADIWKGLIVAVITPIITIILDSLNAGSLNFDWKHIGITALTALLAYLVKNFLTPSSIMIHDAPKEQVQAVKDGAAKAVVMPS